MVQIVRSYPPDTKEVSALRYADSNGSSLAANIRSASEEERKGVLSRSLLRSASFPPSESTRWVASFGITSNCLATSVVVVPSTAKSVARHVDGSAALKCATTSGSPRVYDLLSKME